MAFVLHLPGGLVFDGQLRREVELRPLTGVVERTFAPSSGDRYCQPLWVSRVLAGTVSRIGGVPMSMEIADQLMVGDRIFLMLQLGILHFRDLEWLTPRCEQCGTQFDVPIKRSELPVSGPRSPQYPSASIDVNGHKVIVRGICGGDQRWLVETCPDDPERALIARCVLSIDDEEPLATTLEHLLRADRGPIESAIAECCPDVDCTLHVRCPECKTIQAIEFEPYWLGLGDTTGLDSEVHRIAWSYHWSEAEILSLTRQQRRSYLALIDRERGRHA